MVSFIICLAILIGGYFTYGKLVEKTFGPDDRETPAVAINDGVDYVVLPQWKLFLIQLLNIAGLGPIFGAMQGALWGPVVFLWITFGTVFAGGVHDYFSGMMSERNNGMSISEVTGIYLGNVLKQVMRVFSVILLVMVGTVFAAGPAGLLKVLFANAGWTNFLANNYFWLVIVLAYYFTATFISIDKIIGKIYPVFGFCLIVMAVGVAIGIPANGYQIPEIWTHFYNMHPDGTPIWSAMFITVACGAISGFHSTQSPLMARCMKSEKQGHFVFYGAMVSEGIIALIWAAAGCALYAATNTANDAGMLVNSGLATALKDGQAAAIYAVCKSTMGTVGVVLAMLGVIACPITSGDTAFRSARLTIADWFHIDQKPWGKRLALCVPLLGVGAILAFMNNYSMIWQHFSWTNQTLAMIVLWAAAMFLYYEKKNYWIAAVPATFMTAVSVTFFVTGKIYLHLPHTVGVIVGIIFAALFLGIFLYVIKVKKPTTPHYDTVQKKA
ncbi:MAG: carbon starvation protein A [Lachnospiraceae bacterium]|jgi:carbon starvation protein CstA|nr:carbon starvation protein A [Lachnospiraceae bacterium]MCI1727099.1 carbon starvation protein A [Lachnospiraceae bacterium]